MADIQIEAMPVLISLHFFLYYKAVSDTIFGETLHDVNQNNRMVTNGKRNQAGLSGIRYPIEFVFSVIPKKVKVNYTFGGFPSIFSNGISICCAI